MSKAVMWALHPKQCENIVNGKQTIIVSKTILKDVIPPFKVYIYSTKEMLLTRSHYNRDIYATNKKAQSALETVGNQTLSGKVIGEFVCDSIEQIVLDYNLVLKKFFYGNVTDLSPTCLSEEELQKYAGIKPLYFLHISNLKIYDKPKELGEFKSVLTHKDIRCKYISKPYNPYGKQLTICTLQNCYCEFHSLGHQTDCDGYEQLKKSTIITRPPKPWCYVDEL